MRQQEYTSLNQTAALYSRGGHAGRSDGEVYRYIYPQISLP